MLRLLTLAVFAALPAAVFGEQRTDDVETGRETYLAHCAACHGRGGKGDGPVAAVLKTPPPDLTRLAARNRGRFPGDRIATYVVGERRGASAHGSTDMPVWGPLFRELNPHDSRIDVRLSRLLDHLASFQVK
jgi:mono/diheme cytochrome c family protein